MNKKRSSTREAKEAKEVEEVAQMRPSRLGVVQLAAKVGVSTKDIPRYIPPCGIGAQPRKLTKN